jgi:hypothetical protein
VVALKQEQYQTNIAVEVAEPSKGRVFGLFHQVGSFLVDGSDPDMESAGGIHKGVSS